MMMKITKVHDSVTPSIAGILRAIDIQGRRRVLIKAGEKFVEMTKSNFGQSGRYRSKNWSPLSKEYAEQKGSALATDIKTRKLMNSIKLSGARTNWIEIYTKNPYETGHCLR